MKTLFLISTAAFIFLISQQGFSTVLVSGVTGASDSDYTTDTSAPVIYGGTAGSNCSASAESLYVTCDSCASLTSLSICNPARIYDGLYLRIYFKSDTKVGVGFIEDSDGNRLTLQNTPTSKAVNETHVVEVLWSTICAAAEDGASSCEDNDITGNIKVGVDADADDTEDTLTVSIKVHDPDINNTGSFDTISYCEDASVTSGGICDFRAFPGDEKIKIDQLGQSNGFPTSSNITVKYLRFFIASKSVEGGFVTNPNQGTIKDLEVTTNSDGSPETATRNIDDLTNGEVYYLRVATMDQARNISRFTSDAAIEEYCDSVSDPVDGCNFIARPDEVLGLLEEDMNCFVTSVTYGSALDPRVGIFRQFRSQILRQFYFGQKFIEFYYQQGPYAAVWIIKNPEWKPVVRTLLWPALAFAWLSLHLGLFWTIFISFMFTFAVLTSIRFVLQGRKTKALYGAISK